MPDVDQLVDPATSLSSQWHFEIVLDFLFPIAHRGVTLTLALFGIDERSWAEDHQNQDQVVTDLGLAIGGVTRNSDLVARFDEDKFVCLLPLCNIQGGLVFADRIRDALEDFTKRTGTTVSAGLTSHRGEGDGTVADMLNALRGALVAARSAGGDRVEISSEGWNV